MDQGLPLSELVLVLEELHDVSPQWYRIGLQLKLSPDTMDKIKGEESDHLLEMLKVWLKRVEPKPTWEALVQALRSRSVGREKEANRLEDNYCKGRAVSKTLSDAPMRANKQQPKGKAEPVIPKCQPQVVNTETALTTSAQLQKSTEDAKKTTKRASTSTNDTQSESKMPIQKKPKVQQSERLVGGYRFLEPPPENLTCTRCKSINTDPKQLKCCGKLLCQSCEESCPRRACPNCGKRPIDSFPDKKSSDEIQNLEVECSNAEKGCSWKGKLKELEHHRHSTCLKEEIVCPYSEAGCEIWCLREEMDDHQTQSQKHHLDRTLETIKTLKDELQSQTAKLTAIMEKSHSPPLIIVMPISVTNQTETWYSPPFYTSARGYKICLEITPHGNNCISMKVSGMTGDNDDHLNLPCSGTVSVKIQSTNARHIFSQQMRFTYGSSKPDISRSFKEIKVSDVFAGNLFKKITIDRAKQYIQKDDSVHIEISEVKLDYKNTLWILNPQAIHS